MSVLPRGRTDDPVQSHDQILQANTGTTQPRQASNIGQPHQSQRRRNKPTKNSLVCRYFGTKAGCRAGDACPYRHEIPATIQYDAQSQAQSEMSQPQLGEVHDGGVGQLSDTNHAVGTLVALAANAVQPVQPQPRLVVTRPISKAQTDDPREFQLSQIKRRFSPEVRNGDQGTSLTFQLNPSDPDFPFELNGLKCTLIVPKGYPDTGKPAVRVSNPEMERGYQINVERGFEMLVDQNPQKSLLSLMNELDKNLEKFLISEKAQTVKIVVNSRKTVSPQIPIVPPEVAAQPSSSPEPARFSSSSNTEASAKRESDIRQLEARMGRQLLFSKSADGTSINIPLLVSKPHRLPLPLQSLKDITLLIPLLYNLEPCTIILNGTTGHEAGLVEAAFERRARQQSELSLMAHVNHLAQNMHLMVHESRGTPREAPVETIVPEVTMPSATEAKALSNPAPTTVEDEKPHIKVIPRPPEWSMPNEHSDENESSDTYDSDGEFSDSEDGGIAVPEGPSAGGPERGVLVSFPFLELYGIEVLKLASVSITVKCDRCKTVADMRNIQPQKGGTSAQVKIESCNKCASGMSVSYRSELLHTNSVRAGFLDLDGCTVVDLLPSAFIPTCSECSTDYSASGLVSVRGDTTLAMCRECHHRMSFKIPEVKFLRVSNAGTDRPDRPLPRKKAKENLGIVAGQELPRRGRCQHYGKSYRWFRFSCCSKVYACDRCHDAAEEHPNEHANRMICGFCSREQAYRPEDCGLCHSGVVGKKGGGFWEGGKGTRDKLKMSRKDPRKYKRRGGGAVVGGTGKGKAK